MENEILITAQIAKGSVPATGTLEDRLLATMRAVRTDDNINWMCRNDDQRFRSAIGAVMLASPDDQDRIARSMAPLKALSAAMSGVPVDFSSVLTDADDLVPLISLWHESAKPVERDSKPPR